MAAVAEKETKDSQAGEKDRRILPGPEEGGGEIIK